MDEKKSCMNTFGKNLLPVGNVARAIWFINQNNFSDTNINDDDGINKKVTDIPYKNKKPKKDLQKLEEKEKYKINEIHENPFDFLKEKEGENDLKNEPIELNEEDDDKIKINPIENNNNKDNNSGIQKDIKANKVSTHIINNNNYFEQNKDEMKTPNVNIIKSRIIKLNELTSNPIIDQNVMNLRKSGSNKESLQPKEFNNIKVSKLKSNNDLNQDDIHSFSALVNLETNHAFMGSISHFPENDSQNSFDLQDTNYNNV